MSIDVGCGREGAVSEPDLNLFHGDSFAEKQAGTSVPKIMEADLLKESSVHFLHFFQQKNLDLRDQRKGSEARFGFEDSSPTGTNLPFISASMTLCRMEIVFLVRSIAFHLRRRTSIRRKL